MHWALYVVLLCLPFTALASKLPPEHESARLLLIVEEAVNNANWSLADDSLNKMADLKTDLPVPFYFYNGLVHFKQERFDKAQLSLEHYIVKVGASGAFYYDALRLITLVEEAASKPKSHFGNSSANTEDQVETPPTLVNQERDAYIQSLQALFLTDSPANALLMQINSLLNAHPYSGSRVKKSSEQQGIKYQVSLQDNVIVLQERSFLDGFPRLSAEKLEVSGVDPFIEYDCSTQQIACWLYHPANAHQKWLMIDLDELVVAELSQAFTRLIQLLQKK